MDLTKDELFDLATALLSRMCHCTDKFTAENVELDDYNFWHREWERASKLHQKTWWAYKALTV